MYRALDLATGEIVAVKRLLFENGELDQEVMVNIPSPIKGRHSLFLDVSLLNLFYKKKTVERSSSAQDTVSFKCDPLFRLHSEQT